MNTKKFALIGGIVMLVLGIVSLLPELSRSAFMLPELKLENSYGLFLGYFPMNILNKLALIGFGLWGIGAARSNGTHPALQYSRAVFFVMGIAAILGAIPATATLFGYWPLYGGEILLHGIAALFGGYFGFVSPVRANRAAHA